MEVEYSGGGVLIFSYLILIHRLDNFGCLRVAKLSRGSLIRVSSLAATLMARQCVQKRFARSKLSRGSMIRVSSLAASLMARQ